MTKDVKFTCLDTFKLLILVNLDEIMIKRFYVSMGISVAALAVGFILLFG